VRLDFLLGQDLAHRPLGQLRQARMPGGRFVLPGMRSEQPGGPQLVGITQLLGLAARQCHQPSFRRGRDDGIASRTRTVIECLDYPQLRRALQATCHCLLRHPHRARHGTCSLRRCCSRRHRAVRWPQPGRQICGALIEEIRFAPDSALEGDGFEPSVPQQIRSRLRDGPVPPHHGLTVSQPGTEGSTSSESTANPTSSRAEIGLFA
jgi:hypothetical protein